jgi:plastocyanin
MAGRGWLLSAEVALVGALAAFAFPSAGSGYISSKSVSLTASGPSPSTLKMGAGNFMLFDNTDSVTHTVVFANGLCSLTLSPGEQAGPGNELGPDNPDCNDNFTFGVGSYAYSVDGTHSGTVDTLPAYRSVTLEARTHALRAGERLTLHGRVAWDNTCCEFATTVPFPVVVLARSAGSDSFKVVAAVATRGLWHVKVRPGVATTYIAKVSGQLPGALIWRQATSRPFTVRMRR